jgi:hypothetical protein
MLMSAFTIFTRFHHLQWLENIPWIVARQSYRDFDVTVDEDGSGSAKCAEYAIETAHKTCALPA